MVEIGFTGGSKKQLKNLNTRIKQNIIYVLDKFQSNQPVDIIKLKNKDDEFRIRTGNYRMQLKKVDKDFLVTKAGKRENFYGIFFNF